MKLKIQKLIYWLLSVTCGVIPTILGFIATFILRITNCYCEDNGYGLITTIGGNWGGLSVGPFAFCGNYKETDINWYDHTRKHEFGHSIQNVILGPLWIFLVAIPSVIRYWVFIIRIKQGKTNPEYDSVWFEGTATKYGTKAIEKIEKK